jgi:hypothetical protein
LGARRRSILFLRLRRFLGYFLFTRNGRLWVIMFLVEHVLHPTWTGVSSFLFKPRELITLVAGLALSQSGSHSALACAPIAPK